MAKKKSTLEELKDQGRSLGREVARRSGQIVDQGQRLAREGAERLESMRPGAKKKKARVTGKAIAAASGVAAALAGVAAVAGAAVIGARKENAARPQPARDARSGGSKRFRVAPRKQGGWAVEASGRTLSHHETKKEAVAAGRAAARSAAGENTPSELVIQDSQGREQSSHSYDAAT